MNIKSVLIQLYGKVSIMSIQIKTKVSKSTLLPASFYMNCSTMISMVLLSVLFCKGRVPQPKKHGITMVLLLVLATKVIFTQNVNLKTRITLSRSDKISLDVYDY